MVREYGGWSYEKILFIFDSLILLIIVMGMDEIVFIIFLLMN